MYYSMLNNHLVMIKNTNDR
ncbi:hypothetical protein FOXB_07330 [Fusarium oxysporum f. sp. conglutinans Fo5176]|uniref:Uncharacterized protein n=1 Tax=Fusarium oxysporum (strain Fo5176) TaxID=660025 RepID=F9FLQ0_FUSOF|nr:hypothetical protein FOXB_07330 [Fusarium oxysporum f. sp. conglutinans Fo5176]